MSPLWPGEQRAEPERVDVVERRRRPTLSASWDGVDEQVVDALVPVLAEGRAAHADDRHAVPDPVAGHAKLLLVYASEGSGLPEVVVHAVGGHEPPERHLDAVADRHRGGVHVGQLAREAAAALEVDARAATTGGESE